jgi:PPM family protein phosphatase
MIVDTGQKSDVGRVRPVNEDAVRVYAKDSDASKGSHLFIVADGIGGEAHGDVASQIAAETTANSFYAYLADHPNVLIETALKHAITQANETVYREAENRDSAGHMGTTIVTAALTDRRLTVGWVGDSRAYLMRNGKESLHQLTVDHTFVEMQLRNGRLTPEEAQKHPRRNVLIRSLGSQPTVIVDVISDRADPDDIILLCSDGLTRHVNAQEMAKLLRHTPNAQRAASSLVDLANDRGGRDNVSVVVVRLTPPSEMAAGDFFDMDTQVGTAQTNPEGFRLGGYPRNPQHRLMIIALILAVIALAGILALALAR